MFLVSLTLILLIAAFALSGFDVAVSRARSAVGWAVFLLSLALILQ